MIHRYEDKFTISSHDVWVPGIYDTEAAARYAMQFPNVDLEALQRAANDRAGGTGGCITMDDLREHRKEKAK